MRAPALCGLALLFGHASSAWARPPSVYINDVKVDGLSRQTFKNVDVTFDDKGDIRIVAKGYEIQAVEPTPAPSAGTARTVQAGHHFYIAAVQPSGRIGMSGWDVDVYINQTFVKRFRSKDADPVFEITRFLKPGANVIHFSAKRDAGERESTSPTDYFELVLGDGEMRAGQALLNKITAYRRTAAETGTFDSETTLNVATQ